MATQTAILDGNEAAGRGALLAGCTGYFGYPITPQNEIGEFMSAELPKIGGIYMQGAGEAESGFLVLAATAAGIRAMTSTSGPGFSAMQEAISHMHSTNLPVVIVEVTRLGPGCGTIQQGQTDYRHVTKGAIGAIHQIVLAPFSVQETLDFTQLAFHLADKYRNPVMVLMDYILGHLTEKVELRTLDFGPLPPKDWALKGKASRGGKSSKIHSGLMDPIGWYRRALEKYQAMVENETRYAAYFETDAELLLVAYGSHARIALQAAEWARAEGKKVGVFRPITLWPFPGEALKRISLNVKKVLVVEDSPGELVEDVEGVIRDRVPVYLLNIFARDVPTSAGLILPERVLEEIRTLSK